MRVLPRNWSLSLRRFLSCTNSFYFGTARAIGTVKIVLPVGPTWICPKRGLRKRAEAGQVLLEQGFTFDVAFTSVLKRAIRTLWIVLDGMDLMWIPVHRSWRLNERHYGALQGLNKAETAERFGEAAGQTLAAQLRHSAACPGNLGSALPRTGSPLRRPFGPGTPSHRVLERHRRPFPAVLARNDCPGHPRR